jgi:hypothetical protein
MDADDLAVAPHVDRLDSTSRWVGHESLGRRIRPQRHVRPRERRPHTADVRLALRVQLADERVARVAQDAAVVLAYSEEAKRERRRMQSLLAKLLDDRRHFRRVRDRLVGIRRS